MLSPMKCDVCACVCLCLCVRMCLCLCVRVCACVRTDFDKRASVRLSQPALHITLAYQRVLDEKILLWVQPQTDAKLALTRRQHLAARCIGDIEGAASCAPCKLGGFLEERRDKQTMSKQYRKRKRARTQTKAAPPQKKNQQKKSLKKPKKYKQKTHKTHKGRYTQQRSQTRTAINTSSLPVREPRGGM